MGVKTGVTVSDKVSPKAPGRARGAVGVKVIAVRRGARAVFQARWRDADGTPRAVTLDRIGVASYEARRAWCLAKAETLARERAILAAGTSAAAHATARDGVALYIDAVKAELRPSTVTWYARAGENFARWCEQAGVALLRDLTPAHLVQLRGAIIAAARFVPLATAPRGARRKAPEARRSPVTINSELRKAATLLGWLRRAGYVPRLSGDSIRDNLRRTRELRPEPAFLSAATVRLVLQAAIRHDSACFRLTRQEHDGAPAGSTPRHAPVAPLVAGLLLSGARFAELAGLRRADVDFTADNGNGYIIFPAEKTKTGRARRCPLDVSPALRRMLAALAVKGTEHLFASPGTDTPFSRDLAKSTMSRLRNVYGAPAFGWHQLRKTCAAFSCCAAGLGGAASAFLTAKRLGHSVAVLEANYAGLVSVPPDKTTIEAALGVEDLIETILARVTAGAAAAPAPAAAPAAAGTTR